MVIKPHQNKAKNGCLIQMMYWSSTDENLCHIVDAHSCNHYCNILTSWHGNVQTLLAFFVGIHQWVVHSIHKGSVIGSFDNVFVVSSGTLWNKQSSSCKYDVTVIWYSFIVVTSRGNQLKFYNFVDNKNNKCRMFHALNVKWNIMYPYVGNWWWDCYITALDHWAALIFLISKTGSSCIIHSLEDMYSIRLYIVHHMHIKPPTVSMQTIVPLVNKSTSEVDMYLSARFVKVSSFNLNYAICLCCKPMCSLLYCGAYNLRYKMHMICALLCLVVI